MKVLVTGGSGFIGSAVVRHVMTRTDAAVVNVDKLTYAATPAAVAQFADDPRYAFEQVDICDAIALRQVFDAHKPTHVMHLAAESHVDRSIDGPGDFIQTNIVGSFNMLQAARGYFDGLSGAAREAFRFHHISTDEVFGALQPGDPAFNETTPYCPNSPYSASKAASDHLVRAWGETFGLPAVLSNCSNNYGPWQYPEKLIPLMVAKASAGEPLPIYGKGENIRDWLHVEDHAEALWLIATRGKIGESYNVGGDSERTNIDVVRAICAVMDELRPRNAPHERLMTYVADRPGHDFRYAIEASKIRRDLGWSARYDFETGIRATVTWYLENEHWWRSLLAAGQATARVGLGGRTAR